MLSLSPTTASTQSLATSLQALDAGPGETQVLARSGVWACFGVAAVLGSSTPGVCRAGCMPRRAAKHDAPDRWLDATVSLVIAFVCVLAGRSDVARRTLLGAVSAPRSPTGNVRIFELPEYICCSLDRRGSDEVRVSGPSLPSSRSGPAAKGGPTGPSEASREAAPLTAGERRLRTSDYPGARAGRERRAAEL